MGAPERYAREFLVEAGVMVPGWMCDWLEVHTNVSAVRVRVRGENRQADEVLQALRYAAMAHRAAGSASGTAAVDVVAAARHSDPSAMLDVRSVAALVGVTSRAVRKAIAEKRLAARSVSGRWLVERADADRWAYARRDAA